MTRATARRVQSASGSGLTSALGSAWGWAFTQVASVKEPRRGLHVPKARLTRFIPQHPRPPLSDFNRRLTRQFNMLNLFMLVLKTIFHETFTEVSA